MRFFETITIAVISIATSMCSFAYNSFSRDAYTGLALPAPKATPSQVKLLSLQDAVYLALRNNSDVEGFDLDQVLNKFSLEVARWAFQPQYSLSGSATHADGIGNTYSVTPGVSLTTPIGTTILLDYSNGLTGGSGTSTMTITQHLLKGFMSPGRTYQDSIDTAKQSKLTYKSNIMSTVQTVITSYRTVVEDFNSLTTQKESLQTSVTQVANDKIQIKAGTATQETLTTDEANLESTKLSMVTAKSTLENDYQAFLKNLGMNAEARFKINVTIVSHLEKLIPYPRALAIAEKHNIAYQQALITYSTTRRALQEARNGAEWQLDLTATRTLGKGSAAPKTFAPLAQNSEGLNLTVPIHDLTNQQSVLTAKINMQKAEITLNAALRTLKQTIYTDYQQAYLQSQQVVIGENAVKLASLNLKQKQLQKKFGRTTAFEVVSTQDALTSQQITYISDQVSYLNELTTLHNDMGTLLKKWQVTLRY